MVFLAIQANTRSRPCHEKTRAAPVDFHIAMSYSRSRQVQELHRAQTMHYTALLQPQRTQIFISSTTTLTSTASSRGAAPYTYDSYHQQFYYLMTKIEDDAEDDEGSEPASSDPPSHNSHYSQRSSDRQAQVTTTTSQTPCPIQKGLKVFHRVLGKLRRRSPERLPPITSYLPTTRAVTMGSASWSAYDSGPYNANHRLNTRTSISERTRPPTIQNRIAQPHPPTLARIQAAEQVREPMHTKSSKSEDITRWTNGVRRFHDKPDSLDIHRARMYREAPRDTRTSRRAPRETSEFGR